MPEQTCADQQATIVPRQASLCTPCVPQPQMPNPNLEGIHAMQTQTSRDTVQQLRAVHVENERDHDLRCQLTRLLQDDSEGKLSAVPCRFTNDQETRGIALIEASGGGKTTSIRRALLETDVLGINPKTDLPRYLQIQVPSPATLKSVGVAILKATGLTGVTERATGWEIWDTVRYRLHLLGIVVLWIDEAQDLILAKTASETEMTLRMLKSLMQGDTAVILILSGTQRLAEMTNFDPQVSRRFTKIMPRDLEFSSDQDDLADLICNYCEIAGLKPKIGDDLACRLIHASRRRFGRAVETIINAIERALEDGETTLTIAHFADAWAMQEGCDAASNVFDAVDWQAIVLDAGADEYDAARTMRQQKKLGKG